MKNDMLAKLMAKKGEQDPIDPTYKQAKMSMLQALHGEMGKMMGQDLKDAKDMKKVSVAADNNEDLKAGLDQAKNLVGNEGGEVLPEGDDSDLEASDDDQESPFEDNKDKLDAMSGGMADDGAEDAEKIIGDLVSHEMSEGDLSDDKIDMLIDMLQKKKLAMGKEL